MKKLNIVKDTNVPKKFKGGTSIIYLLIFLIIVFINIFFADYQKYGLSRLTDDYSKDQIIMSIIQFVIVTYMIIVFTSKTLKERTFIVTENIITYLKGLSKKLGIDINLKLDF